MKLVLALAVLPLLVSPVLAAHPDPVVVVRSRMAPLSIVRPGAAPYPMGPRSPAGFGLEAGRLRVLATSDALGIVVVELAGPGGGTLFTLRLMYTPHPDITRVVREERAKTTAVGLDVALSPDGRRLLYVDGLEPKVLVLDDATRAPTVIRPPAATAAGRRVAAPDSVRIERPRWLDDEQVIYERAVTRRDGAITTTIEIAPADGSAPARYLIAPSGRQDRLAAVVGDHVLAYRDGVLSRWSGDAKPVALATRFQARVVAPWPNVLGRVERAWIEVGDGGVVREIALATLDASGTLKTRTPRRTAYLDPLVGPDRDFALWSVKTAGGFVVERVSDDGIRALTPPHTDPIELVTFVPSDSSHGGRSLVAGCRGGDVIVVDAEAGGAPRVLTRAPDNPSCTVRAATSTHVVFERRTADGWRLEMLPIIEPSAASVMTSGTFVATVGDRVLFQSGHEGIAKIVHEASADPSTHVTLVPWSEPAIERALRTTDGRTVVFRRAGDPRWYAVRVDRPGAVVTLTAGSDDSIIALGLADDRMLAWDPARQRIIAWRLDGSDARQPQVVLERVAIAGPYAANVARVLAVAADGAIVSASIDGVMRSKPTIVLPAGSGWPTPRLLYDAGRKRVVALSRTGAVVAIVAAGVFGQDALQPHVLGVPRPPPDSDVHALALLENGDVVLTYATRYTAVPHPSGREVLAADGSGPRPASALPPDLPDDHGLALSGAIAADGAYGEETRTVIESP